MEEEREEARLRQHMHPNQQAPAQAFGGGNQPQPAADFGRQTGISAAPSVPNSTIYQNNQTYSIIGSNAGRDVVEGNFGKVQHSPQ